MIRGYNFPSGTAEKVTIDGNKVTEKMSLYTYAHTMDFKLDKKPTNLKFPHKDGIIEGFASEHGLALLPDESVLEYPYVPANMGTTYGSSNPKETNFTKIFNVYKKDGTRFATRTPNYTIPTTSQNGKESYNQVSWKSIVVSNHLGDIYIIIQRTFTQDKNSTTWRYGQSYISVWKLNITSTEISWTQKCLEIPLTDTDSPKGPPSGVYDSTKLIYIDDNDLIMYGNRANGYGSCIYILPFGETAFYNVPIEDLSGSYGPIDGGFVTKLNNTIYYYFINYDDEIKAGEIDYDTKSITKTLVPTTEFQNIINNCQKTGFIENNKLYFTELNYSNSTFTIYEFNPVDWNFIAKTVVNGVDDYQLFMNQVPQYIKSDTQIWYFNPNNHLEAMGPYMLPELIDYSLGDDFRTDYILKRYYFLPNQGYILTYVETCLYSPWDEVTLFQYDYRVYIRRLDNKPLIYTTSLEAAQEKNKK